MLDLLFAVGFLLLLGGVGSFAGGDVFGLLVALFGAISMSVSAYVNRNN